MILLESQASSVRLIKKVYFLLHDFTINDASIFADEDKVFVRRRLSENDDFIHFCN
jgi:hypothetical protein